MTPECFPFSVQKRRLRPLLSNNPQNYYLFLTATGLTPGGSSAVHIYTQTAHRIQKTERT
jgi:hypothetical protein